MNENKSLIKKALEAYGNDLKPKRLTSKAGEKLNEQAVEFRQRLIESAPIGSGGVEAKTRVEELFDELTEAGVRIFFRNMVNLFIPSTVAAGELRLPKHRPQSEVSLLTPHHRQDERSDLHRERSGSCRLHYD